MPHGARSCDLGSRPQSSASPSARSWSINNSLTKPRRTTSKTVLVLFLPMARTTTPGRSVPAERATTPARSWAEMPIHVAAICANLPDSVSGRSGCLIKAPPMSPTASFLRQAWSQPDLATSSPTNVLGGFSNVPTLVRTVSSSLMADFCRSAGLRPKMRPNAVCPWMKRRISSRSNSGGMKAGMPRSVLTLSPVPPCRVFRFSAICDEEGLERFHGKGFPASGDEPPAAVPQGGRIEPRHRLDRGGQRAAPGDAAGFAFGDTGEQFRGDARREIVEPPLQRFMRTAPAAAGQNADPAQGIVFGHARAHGDFAQWLAQLDAQVEILELSNLLVGAPLPIERRGRREKTLPARLARQDGDLRSLRPIEELRDFLVAKALGDEVGDVHSVLRAVGGGHGGEGGMGLVLGAANRGGQTGDPIMAWRGFISCATPIRRTEAAQPPAPQEA